jgi:hypothetical protein
MTDKRLVDNNENAMNVENNNDSENIIISDNIINNIGGHISGQKSTGLLANNLQENNENLFSFVSAKSVKNSLTNNELIGDNDEDRYDEEQRFLDERRGYEDDFDVDEDYEREGEYDEESEDEDLLQSAGTTTVFGLSEFDRSLGEVYTIPEEEEDITSPQLNGKKKNGSQQFKLAIDNDLNSDTAATLQRWRGN